MTATETTHDARLHDQPDVVDPLELVNAQRYAAVGYPHEAFGALREQSPVHWCEPPGFRPFWAVTRHEDVRYLSCHPELFLSAPRTIIFSRGSSDAELDAAPHAHQPRPPGAS